MIIITKKQLNIISFIIILILICVFTINIYSNAVSEANIYLSSSKQVIDKEEEVEISININGNKTTAFTSYLYFDNTKFEFVSGPENINVIDNYIIYVWYDNTGGSSPKTLELGVFKFKAKQEGIADFVVQGEFYGGTGQELKTTFNNTKVQIGTEETKLEKMPKEEAGTNVEPNNALLQSLRLDLEGITPDFKENIYQYYITVENRVENIGVQAISQNPNAIINITGNTKLKNGLNNINIKVTSQDGTQTQNYAIQVTKTENIEAANTNLETLAIENVELTPPFTNQEINYKAEISKDIENLKILAIPENEAGTVTINGNTNLQEGENTVTIDVTAPNGFTKKEYTILIYKRNEQEEAAYIQTQEQNKQELENAYKIEEVSAQDTNQEEETNQVKEESTKPQTNTFYIFLVFILAAIIFIIYKLKHFKRKMKL